MRNGSKVTTKLRKTLVSVKRIAQFKLLEMSDMLKWWRDWGWIYVLHERHHHRLCYLLELIYKSIILKFEQSPLPTKKILQRPL